uniref:Uncharacterized protein n=1 Tax=Schistosoma haematobium TaxID=6185 RepID=A0A094ZTU8_SCHHA
MNITHDDGVNSDNRYCLPALSKLTSNELRKLWYIKKEQKRKTGNNITEYEVMIVGKLGHLYRLSLLDFIVSMI